MSVGFTKTVKTIGKEIFKMNISRKDFFKKSLLSLGEAVCSVSNALKPPPDTPSTTPDVSAFVPEPRSDRQAAAHNDHCLAKNSGCFACVEHCEVRAIRLIPGVGIRINVQLCTGCGTCQYVCPTTPKAVRMQPRSTPHLVSANNAAISHPKKGDTTC